METTTAPQDRVIRIASEGLRLVLECKVPQFCCLAPTGGSVDLTKQLQQQQREWLGRLPVTLPLLLDWIEQHRGVLFPGAGPVPVGPPVVAAVQEFQRYFVLVFLERSSNFLRIEPTFQNIEHLCQMERRLGKFREDVRRILTASSAIRNWLFHYYGNALGLQGWVCRPGDLNSLHRLFEFLRYDQLDHLFEQRMFSFLERVAKELLGFAQNTDYQTLGVVILSTMMGINHEKGIHTRDAEEVLKKVLSLTREVSDDYAEEMWNIIHYSVASIRAAANSSMEEEILLNLLAHLNEAIMKKEHDRNFSFDDGSLGYLQALTLLVLADVPEVDVKESNFDELTIGNRNCSRDKFRRHVQSSVRTAGGNLRVSMNIKLRIAKMIPKLFAGFSSRYYVNFHAYNCLELLTWMTMFPVSHTRQQQNARAIMLRRLAEEMKRLGEDFIKNSSEYSYDEEELQLLYDSLEPLLTVVREGVQLLPDSGWFRRFRRTMRMLVSGVLVLLEMLKLFKTRVESEELW